MKLKLICLLLALVLLAGCTPAPQEGSSAPTQEPPAPTQDPPAPTEGTTLPVETIVDIVRENPLCRGVTFSGGEPFAQAAGFAELARLLKAHRYEVAAYSGYTFEQLLQGTPDQRDLLANIDILIDGPFLLDQRSLQLPFRGSRNQRILDVPKSLTLGQAVEITTGRWTGNYDL